jgi:GGDEF domain-containing protein
MDVRSKQSIQQHLQKEDVQERILQNIHKGRDEATVTISRAADLFGITENKLRDWEEYGFLNPLRPGGPKGRRLYTPSELDKLAIIRELINSGYSASDIPADIDKVWYNIRSRREPVVPTNGHETLAQSQTYHFLEQPINLRIAHARTELFWRYYATHALRLALMLICEDIPHITSGLLLPLTPGIDTSTILRVDDIATLGESLVGWLSQSGSSHTLLTSQPSFQYSSDFRVEPLQIMKAGMPQEDPNKDNTLIIVQREASPLTLSKDVVTTVRGLLQPLYTNRERSRACLGPGMRDVLDSATDLDSSTNYEDVILNGLSDMVIQLGKMTAEGQPRWRFCWILLPRDSSQFLHLSNLVIRGQNQNPFFKSKSSIVSSDKHANNPYLKALQSRHILYQPDIPPDDIPTAFRDLDRPIRSAIALPIAGEDGLSIGVLYVASHVVDAFTMDDQRILRFISRMIEELLKTYRIRQHVTQKLTDMVKNPGLVDTFFEGFASENDFNHDIETLLSTIQKQITTGQREDNFTEKAISFIALDIDKQSSLANKYGDRLVRNLTREVGLRLQEQIRTFFKEYPDCQLYHIYADRFFIVLKNTSLEQTREHAERLRMGAFGTYKLDALRIFSDQHTRPESMVELDNISVCLSVTSYPYPKLEEILHEYTLDYAVTQVRSIITSALDVALVKGKIEGGNVVISWDYDIRNFVRWSPTKNK